MALTWLLAERFTREEILWRIPLHEALAYEHCAYVAARVPVRRVLGDDKADRYADILAPFRKPAA